MLGRPRLAMVEHFPDTNDGNEPRGEGGFRFLRDGFVGLAEELPSFRMTDDDVAASGLDKHLGRDFSGESAFLFVENVLRRDGDLCTASGFDSRMNGRKGRRDDDVALRDALHQHGERREKYGSFHLRLVHLPVSSDDGTACHTRVHAGHFFCRLVGQGLDAWKLGASQKLEGGAASGRNVRDSVRDA